MITETLQRLEPYTDLPSPPETITNDAARAAWFRDGSTLVEKGLLDAISIGPFEMLCQLEGQISEAIARETVNDWMRRLADPTIDNLGPQWDDELVKVYRDLRADFGLPA